MRKTIPNSMQSEIEENGVIIGKFDKKQESDVAHGFTYLYNDKFYHLCFSSDKDNWLVFITEFDESDDLSEYVDDVEAAQNILEVLKIKK